MGILSLFRELAKGEGSEQDKAVHAALKQARARGEAASQGDVVPGRVRKRFRFVGSVQGVGFRWTTTRLAEEAGVTGWVGNESDGSVTAEMQGLPEQIDAVLAALDSQYNGRKWMGGFSIDDVSYVDVVTGEDDFHPAY